MNAATTTGLLDAALAHASRGWPVFPVHGVTDAGQCACGKPDCRDAGKHPRTWNGLKDATTDPRMVTAWWSGCPDANIAVATGRQAGVVVVDVDPDAGGYASIDALQDRYEPLPATLACATGGGGLHLYFRYPTMGAVRNSAGKLGSGLDIRGDGGYVIVPPSRHRSGNRYRWTGLDEATAIAPAPEWLLSLLIESSSPSRIGAHHGTGNDIVAPIPAGQRNSTLTSKAGILRRHGFSEAEIAAALLVMNADRCTPALPEEDVRRIAKSVARYAPADPPSVSVPGGRTTPLRAREVRYA